MALCRWCSSHSSGADKIYHLGTNTSCIKMIGIVRGAKSRLSFQETFQNSLTARDLLLLFRSVNWNIKTLSPHNGWLQDFFFFAMVWKSSSKLNALFTPVARAWTLDTPSTAATKSQIAL